MTQTKIRSGQLSVTPTSRLVGIVINDTTVGVGGIATYDVSNIPAGYAYLELIWQGKFESTGVDDGGINITLNNDNTDANYRSLVHYQGTANGNAIADSRFIGYFGTSNGTYTCSQGRLIIPNYDSGMYKTVQSYSFERYTDVGGMLLNEGMVMWESTAAINRITLGGSSDIAQGSRLILIGWKAESVLE